MDFKSRFNNRTSFASKTGGYNHDTSMNSRKNSTNNNINTRLKTFSASSQNTYYNYSPSYEASTYRQYNNDNYMNDDYSQINNSNYSYIPDNSPNYYHQQQQQSYYTSNYGNYSDPYTTTNNNPYSIPQQQNYYQQPYDNSYNNNNGYYDSYNGHMNREYEYSDDNRSYDSPSIKSNYKSRKHKETNRNSKENKERNNSMNKYKSKNKTKSKRSNKRTDNKSSNQTANKSNNNSYNKSKRNKNFDLDQPKSSPSYHNSKNKMIQEQQLSSNTKMTTSAVILSQYPTNYSRNKSSRSSNRSYKPYTLKEYKQIPKEIKALPSLGPDLENEDLIKKKERAKQINDYSRQIRLENAKRIIKSSKTTPTKPKIKENVTISSRERAWEFAKSLPKPTITVQPPKTKNKKPKTNVSNSIPLGELSRRNEDARKGVNHIRKLLNYAV